MVGDLQIVIDSLGNVHGAEVVIRYRCHFGDDVRGLGGIVSADVEEIAHVILSEHLKHFFAFGLARLEAHRTQCGGGGGGDQFKLFGALRGEIDEVFFHDPGDAVARAENAGNVGLFARRQHRADQRLVDDGGRSARLPDDHLANQLSPRSHSITSMSSR